MQIALKAMKDATRAQNVTFFPLGNLSLCLSRGCVFAKIHQEMMSANAKNDDFPMLVRFAA